MTKKILGVTILSLVFIAGCANSVSNIGANYLRANGDENQDYIVPTIDETTAPDYQSGFDKTVNNLLSAKEVDFSFLNLKIDTSSIDPISIKFKDLQLDLSHLNSLDLNLATTLQVTYPSNDSIPDIDETLDFRFESNSYCYFASNKLVDKDNKVNTFAFSAPDNLASLIDTINAVMKMLGKDDLPNRLKGMDKISLSDVIATVADGINYIGESKSDNGYVYNIALNDIAIKNTVVSGLNFALATDLDYKLTSISTISNKPIEIKSDTSSISILLDGACNIKNESTYKKVEEGSFKDLTGANDSILSTVTRIADKEQLDINFKANVKKTSDIETKTVSLNGVVQADVKDTFVDLTKGEYKVLIDHIQGDEKLNDISVHYKDRATYLKLNNLFKAKINNSSISDIFKYISDVSGERAYRGLTDILNKAVNETNLIRVQSLIKFGLDEKTIKDVLNDFEIDFKKQYIKYFTYDNDSFEITLDSQLLKLGDKDIEINVNLKDGQIKDIYVYNIQFKEYCLDIDLEFANYTPIAPLTEEELNYKDYKGIVPIFTSLADMVASKKFAVSYDAIVSDKKNDVSYALDGRIKADMSNVISSNNDIKTIDGFLNQYGSGKYQISLNLNTGENTLIHNLNINYQDNDIFLAYNYDNDAEDYIFKQCLEDNQIGAIKEVIDKHSDDTDASSSVDLIASILGDITESEHFIKLKEDLKSLNLTSLEEILSIDEDNRDPNKIVISIDPTYILEGSSHEGEIYKLDLVISNDDYSIKSISISTIFTSDYSMSFNINFEEYTDSYLTEEEKSKYVRINKANQLLDCFYSLPTQIEKFGVRIDGSLTSYNKEKNTTSTVDINGSSAAVNLLDKTTDEDGNEVLLPDVYGTLYLHHQDLNHIFNSSKTSTKTQKVEFKYDSLSDGSDAQILAEYNDNMHIFLAKSDVVDIYKQIDGIEDGNLLLRYLGVLNGTVKGLPIIDMIKNRDFASLLRFKCIKRIQIDDANEGDGRITLIISPEIIGDHDDKEDFYIYIDYNSNGLTKASISKVIDSSSSKKTISATIQFANFEDIANPDMLSYSGNESKFLNMEGFKTLVRCLIDTTEYNYFHLSGNLKLTVSLSSTISCDCLAKIYVADDTAYAYISIITGDAKSITSDNFYATEFFIKEKEVMVCQTKTDEYTSWFTGYRKTTSEVFKITQSEMISNIVYYLFDYTMDLGSLKTALVVKTGNIILQKIYDSQYGSGSDTNMISFNENNDFSQVIDSATPTFNSDGSGSFDMTLNLNNLISITLMSFSSTTIHVTYTKPVKFNGKDNKHLNYISLSTSIGLGSGDSLISADLSFSASVAGIDHIDDAKAKTNMARYYSFVSAFENEYGVFSDNSKLGLYATEWYQDGSDWKVRSSSNRIMRTYDVKKSDYNINSRSDRIFFYNT